MNTKKFLKEEIRKPIRALQFTVLFSLKFLALWFLRLILWFFFFFLPVILFLVSAFHITTEKVRKKSQEFAQVQPREESASPQSQDTFWSLRNLSYDLRFWKRELEKWRG